MRPLVQTGLRIGRVDRLFRNNQCAVVPTMADVGQRVQRIDRNQRCNPVIGDCRTELEILNESGVCHCWVCRIEFRSHRSFEQT